MSEPQAFLNSKFIPAREAAVSVVDAGFMMGTTVAEQLRTFNGKLFRLEDHLNRLMQSLEIVGVDPGMSKSELSDAAQELASRNHALLDEGDDLGLSMFVTPGTYPTFSAGGSTGPLVCMHTYLLPFHLWREKYETGESLVVTDVQQVPSNCWPRRLKCRSRLHYWLADREASSKQAGARALLLDANGMVTEASTSSLVVFRQDEGLIAPPEETILSGISMLELKQLAENLNVSFSHRELITDDVASADEVLLCSTSPCLLPVTQLDGSPISDGKPGQFFSDAMAAWSESVGIDIVAQARRFAVRNFEE